MDSFSSQVVEKKGQVDMLLFIISFTPSFTISFMLTSYLPFLSSFIFSDTIHSFTNLYLHSFLGTVINAFIL